MTETGRWVFFFFFWHVYNFFQLLKAMAQVHTCGHLRAGPDMLERAFSSLVSSQANAHLPNISTFLSELRSRFQQGWLLSRTLLAYEANPVFGSSVQGPLKSRRSARGREGFEECSATAGVPHKPGFLLPGVCLSDVFMVV